MKVVLFGGAGFIGREVLKQLLADPMVTEVRALSNRRGLETSNKLKVYHSDLANVPTEMIEEVDAIIHLARMNARRFGRWGRSYAAVKGAKANNRLLRLIQKTNPKVKLIYISGSLMYGESEGASESSPLKPISFAREYIIAEKPFLYALKKKTHTIRMIRLPWVIGNGSWLRAFYLNPAKSNKRIPMYGNGDNKMSFIEIEDAARLIAWDIHNRQYGICNFSMDTIASQGEFVEELSKILDLPINEIPDAEFKRKNEKAVYEAFTSSIILKTNHEKVELDYEDWKKALKKHIS